MKIRLLVIIIILVTLLGGCGKIGKPFIEADINQKGTRLNIPNASFEDGNSFTGESISVSDESYYGEKGLKIAGGAMAQIEIPVTDDVQKQLLCVSSYVYLDNADSAEISMEVYADGKYHLARSAETSEKDKWIFLKTEYTGMAYEDVDIEKIRISIKAEGGDVYADLVEAGDYQAINGHLPKMAMIAYQPWYESEENGWGNWQYTAASVHGGENSYPSQIVDGYRKIASVDYPLIGVYDSSDEEVINYHVKFIKAMNIDVIQVNYYANLNLAMLDTFEKLVDACEREDMKISILYEPKIHLNGWIHHDTRDEAILAIEQDIKDFLDKYRDSKALLQYDGVPVIEIFGVNQLRNVEWMQIKSNLARDGYLFYLMGDVVGPGDMSSMLGMFQWSLYQDDLMSAGISEIEAYSAQNNSIVLNWSQGNYRRVPIGLVYPGFDDSKVLGWDLGTARKIEKTGAEFYNAAWDGFETFQDEFGWILIATFNDWNEGTVIEPKINDDYELAIITQERVAEFKGIDGYNASRLYEITDEYMKNRKNKYD